MSKSSSEILIHVQVDHQIKDLLHQAIKEMFPKSVVQAGDTLNDPILVLTTKVTERHFEQLQSKFRLNANIAHIEEPEAHFLAFHLMPRKEYLDDLRHLLTPFVRNSSMTREKNGAGS
jgi:hypothetical protein